LIPNDRNLPNLAHDLVRIHKVITRGLSVGVTRGREFLGDGFPSQDLKSGFADYIRSLVSVVAAHHLGEDTIAFPALKERLPDAPYRRLTADHKKIEAALNPLGESTPEISGANPLAGLGVVVAGLRKILAIWPSHIGLEESSFGSKPIAGVMTPEEQANVSVLMARHSQEHAGPPFLVLPFVLYNLAGADRDAMAATIPAPVRELVQKEWKDQWSLMKPFFLD
jgi:hemerythrin-like domain-containing protein